MGCDIHSVVQVRKNGQWQTVGGLDDNRNYDTFGLLADVRNGSGFAGIDTGDGWIPMSEPRGFPEDFEIDDQDYHDGTWMGDHSHSYLTLQEMIDYEHWNKGTKKRGYVTQAEYEQFLIEGKPQSWCGDVGGGQTVKMKEAQFKKLKASGELPAIKHLYIQIEWSKTYKDNEVYTDIMPALQQYADEHGVGPEDVRMVFGFDS